MDVHQGPQQETRIINAGGISRELRTELSKLMLGGSAVLLQPADFDLVLYGHGDTGVITLGSDQSLSELYLRWARRLWPGSFSEEDDPIDPDGRPIRSQSNELVVFDPVDGSGDRKYGTPGTPSGDGYSSLACYIADG